MLSLDSPRWKELRHAYGSAADIPGVIRTIAAFVPGEPSPWSKIWGSLCHQSSIYPATYAAIPHLVSIAEQGNLTNQLEILVLCGTMRIDGALVGGPVPDDLIEPFESAINKLKELSLDIVRNASAQNRLGRYPLPYLIQSLLALQFGAFPTICCLDRLGEDCEVETECPECDSGVFIDLENIPDDSVDPAARARDLEEGLTLIKETSENEWPSDYIVQIAAALASTIGDDLLAEKILNLRSCIVCENCDHEYRLCDGLLVD